MTPLLISIFVKKSETVDLILKSINDAQVLDIIFRTTYTNYKRYMNNMMNSDRDIGDPETLEFFKNPYVTRS